MILLYEEQNSPLQIITDFDAANFKVEVEIYHDGVSCQQSHILLRFTAGEFIDNWLMNKVHDNQKMTATRYFW